MTLLSTVVDWQHRTFLIIPEVCLRVFPNFPNTEAVFQWCSTKVVVWQKRCDTIKWQVYNMHFYTKNCTPLQISFKEFNRRCRATLLKYTFRWLLLRTTIIFEKIPAFDMEKHELRITKCELRVTTYGLNA